MNLVENVLHVLAENFPTIALAGILLALIIFAFRQLNDGRRNLPPCIPRLPIIGSFPWLRMGTYPMHKMFCDYAEKFGSKIVMCYLGSKPLVAIQDLETFKEAYLKQADIFNGKPTLTMPNKTRPYSNKGILNNNGQPWKEHRRFGLMTLRDFGVGKQSLEDKIIEEVQVLSDSFLEFKDAPFDNTHLLTNAVSNIICSIVFGRRYDYDDEKFKRLLHHMDAMFRQNRFKSYLMLLFSTFSKVINKIKGTKTKIPVEYVIEYIESEINAHVENFDKDNVRDFIDAYLKAMYEQWSVVGEKQSSFNKFELCGTIFDFYLAGTETTSTTMRWALLYLAIHPEIQEKVHEEIDAVIGNAQVTMSQRKKMPYVEATITEVQRLGNIVPMSTVHQTVQDTMLAGYFIPAKTRVMPNLWWMHMDPKVWDNPEQFRPERFLKSDGTLSAKHESFMPFSIGKRVCMGETLARMELFLFFTILLQKFRFRLPEGCPDPDLEPVQGATLQPKPYTLQVKARF